MAPPVRRILFAAAVALCIGLTAVVLFAGWSPDPTVKALETLAVVGAVAAVVFGVFGLIGMRLADYQEPPARGGVEKVGRPAGRPPRGRGGGRAGQARRPH